MYSFAYHSSSVTHSSVQFIDIAVFVEKAFSSTVESDSIFL